MIDIAVIIPARLASTRLPNKVILELEGKTIIERVFDQVSLCKKISSIYIAVDDIKVKNICEQFSKNVVMTSTTHKSGSDRIAEVAAEIRHDYIINVQGDEPFIDPDLIDGIAEELLKGNTVVSAMHRIKTIEELINVNHVKVVCDKLSNALYFSRAVIPYDRDEWVKSLSKSNDIPSDIDFFRHIGIYGYKKDFLLSFSSLNVSYLENIEKLEQLRVLENGVKIKMINTNSTSMGIDTNENLVSARKYLINKRS